MEKLEVSRAHGHSGDILRVNLVPVAQTVANGFISLEVMGLIHRELIKFTVSLQYMSIYLA